MENENKKKVNPKLLFGLKMVGIYILLFAVGFGAPLAMTAIGKAFDGDKAVTTSSSSSSKSSSEKASSHEEETSEEVASQETAVVDDGATASESSAYEEETASSEPAAAASTAHTTVTVPAGTTAFKIAQANGLTLAELQALNPSVNLDNVQAGATLRIN